LDSDEFRVAFRQVNRWDGGYQGELLLTYRGQQTVTDWRLTFELSDTLQSVWNARLLPPSGGRQQLGCESYNRSLKPGDQVTIGYVARGLAGTPGRWALEVSGGEPTPAAPVGGGVRAEFRRQSDWGSGFVGSLRVVNDSSQSASDWRVSLRLSSRLESLWNALVVERQGDTYVLGPQPYNRTLAAGAHTEFGFQASPSGTPQAITAYWAAAPQATPTPTPTPTPSASAPGYLHTEAAQIVDSRNQVVRLRGLNWFGLETSNLAPHGLWARSLDSMLDQIQGLGYNCLRIPFSNDLLRNQGQPNGINFSLNPQLQGLTGLQVLDKLVAGAGQRGLKVILDRHRPDSQGQSELWYSPTCSEEQWLADWETLARRYQNNPTVVAVDLHNEPHGSATWGDGNPATDWRLAAQKAGQRILRVNPNLLIVVEGVEHSGGTSYWWGGNLKGARQHPVNLPVAGRLVYSSHDYATSVFRQSWFDSPSFPANLTALWDAHWGYLVQERIAPVLVGEFGSTLHSATDRIWLQTLRDYLHRHNLSFTYWCWNPNSADTGGILQPDWQTVDNTKQDLLAPLLR
jgi:aryl-phospho-beta-D-glucosidase BglC (GH1 family)